jgi:hypothetical protein
LLLLFRVNAMRWRTGPRVVSLNRDPLRLPGNRWNAAVAKPA